MASAALTWVPSSPEPSLQTAPPGHGEVLRGWKQAWRKGTIDIDGGVEADVALGHAGSMSTSCRRRHRC